MVVDEVEEGGGELEGGAEDDGDVAHQHLVDVRLHGKKRLITMLASYDTHSMYMYNATLHTTQYVYRRTDHHSLRTCTQQLQRMETLLSNCTTP